MIDWKDLLKIAIGIIQEAGLTSEDWTFGGGTALVFYFNHRKSKDVDIFLSNPQFLTRLSPRLNEKAEEISKDYIEQSNFIKLKLNGQEIDFIVAPNLTGLKPEQVYIQEYRVNIDKPQEIIAKKIYYRPESLKIRDIIDIAEVYKNYPDVIEILQKNRLIPNREVIYKRLDYLKKQPVETILKQLSLEKDIDFDKSLKLFEKFIKNLYKGEVE